MKNLLNSLKKECTLNTKWFGTIQENVQPKQHKRWNITATPFIDSRGNIYLELEYPEPKENFPQVIYPQEFHIKDIEGKFIISYNVSKLMIRIIAPKMFY